MKVVAVGPEGAMSSAEQNAFLQAIRENPDDVGLRLIYADWLEENGDPERAEFIRVQCELERLAEHDRRRPVLQAREDALLRARREEWAPPLQGLIHRGEFCRGFLDSLMIDAETFLERAAEVFRLAPVRHLRLLRPAGVIRKLAASEYIGRAPLLDLRAGDLSSAEVAELAASPHLARLKGLDLGHNRIRLGAGLQQLAASPHLVRLQSLAVNGNPLGPRGVRALVAREKFERLADLNLKQTNLGADGLAALLESPLVARLTRLNLDWNPLGQSGGRHLAGCEAVAGLTHLHLRGAQLDDRAAQLLARSPYLGRLVLLDARHNLLTAAGQEALRDRFGDGVIC